MPDPGKLISSLPQFAHRIIGDVRDTVSQLMALTMNRPIGFVSVDLDLYSSTTDALEILKFGPEHYLPAVPMYFDDVKNNITYCEWCGEEAAIIEFNSEMLLRKIGYKPTYAIQNFYVCHILDHPIRNGIKLPLLPLELKPI